MTFKARAVPIPGFPHTGNILGAGAAVNFEWTIRGSEYDGHPAPLVGVNTYFPAGTKINPAGFATCSPTVLKNVGSKACPAKSRATTSGHGLGVVSFGTEVVPEGFTIEGFFAPGGQLQFLTTGKTPASFEIISSSSKTTAGAPYGPKYVTEVPLVETVPGAPDGSAESIAVVAGSAYKKHGKAQYYGTMPNKCPKGGFPLKSELVFANISALPMRVPGEVVTTTYKAPCPRR
ncbi:MAG TPA: hypothetical protein VEJ23_07015 [Solirubrobacteraceae bacterium]|nr:hypothetical protein [Solirubrobacteraceae bacterium]